MYPSPNPIAKAASDAPSAIGFIPERNPGSGETASSTLIE